MNMIEPLRHSPSNASPRGTAPQHARTLSALLFAMVLQACASAPGMRMDADVEKLKARADLVELDVAAVRRLREADAARARDAQPLRLPAAFAAEPGPFEYRVSAQDVLRITVWNQPELTNPSNTSNELSGRVVNADGSLFFPYVGSFTAAGKTVQEIRDHIAQGLQKVIKKPQVDVSVLQYRGQRVYVSGEVRQPGSVAVTDVPPDLAEIVARAGGTTAEADLAAVTVTRGATQARVNLQALYYDGDLRQNLRLRHGDVVNVPERRESKVFVTGEVVKPTPLLMPRGPMTLADALAEAGGVNPLSANAGQIFVLRGAPAERPQVFHLDASAADALLLADQFALQARDVVYVDAARVVRWARVVNNLLGTASFVRELVNDASPAFPR